jgi:site-specific DNA-methyltransferase (adenine-specific)
VAVAAEISEAMIELLNTDCLEYMATLPDKAFDLAIVDPPYGIGGGDYGDGQSEKRRLSAGTLEKLRKTDYDTVRPDAAYFAEVLRVSRSCIIWGGNHFADMLPATAGWVVWDKQIAAGLSLSDCELAWTNIGGRVAKYTQMWAGVWKKGEMGLKRVHPNQKPVALYRWLLKNYAKPGQRILDTHGGSMSIAIACDIEGFDLVCTEIDKDYFEAGKKRLEQHQAQPRLFDALEKVAPIQLTLDGE